MDQTSNIPILAKMTLKDEMSSSKFKLLDRIEGYLYPGYEKTIRKFSTNEGSTEMVISGYDKTYTNPFKGIGEFIQLSGKMGLECFYVKHSPRLNRIITSFEFLNRDTATYTINEAIVFMAYDVNGIKTVSFKSAVLKLVGGVPCQTKLILNKYNLQYLRDDPDLSKTIVTDFDVVPNGEYLPIVFEIYIK